MTTHLHITSWVLALVLFGLAYMFYRQDKEKAGKITQMILRLDYLLILYSGGSLLGFYFEGDNSFLLVGAIVKALLGLWAIAAMEMILIKLNKGKPVSGWLVQLAVAFVLVLGFGFWFLPISV